MRRALLAAAAAAAFLGVTIANAAEPARDERLHAFFDREFTHGLEESPEFATLLGIDGYDDRLGDLSAAAVARRRAHTLAAIAELEAFDPARLSAEDRISRAMMLEELELDHEFDALYADLPFGANDSWLVLTPMFGPQQMLALLSKATPLRNVADYRNYLKRLEAVPGVIDQMIDRMRAGMRSRWMPPRAAMTRVPGMLEVYAGTDVRATPLWHPFESFPTSVPDAERGPIAERGQRVLAERVHPAFAKLKRFAEAEYIPACRKELGASSLPAGAKFYALRVRQATTTTLTPDEIHAIGLSEVKRIHAEIEKVIASTGFRGSWDDFLQFTREDKRFFFDTPEQRLMFYRDIGKRADAELPRLFAELPRLPYGIRPMDPSEGDNADHYSNGALDGSRAGYFDANVNNVSKHPSHEMESTLLHEAVPGHHLQIARAQEIRGLPLFRRVGGYTAYSEGWALYAESLGYEMGFYKDPYQHFGALAGEMLRACRLVIDTGLHTKGWTRDASIRYLVDNTGYHPDLAAAEIDRYIVMPGQALGYKIGELRIKALRAKAAAALGAKFDVRRFHNVLLDDGPLPLTLLEARVDEWIAAEKDKK
jgi:uncharacterized protein (DUF885 family)